jgi:hypothetical protein
LPHSLNSNETRSIKDTTFTNQALFIYTANPNEHEHPHNR